MERYLRENFDIQSKNSSEEALRKWRSAVSLVKNPRRRFRMIADLAKRNEAEKTKLKFQEHIRVSLFVQKAALQFIHGDLHTRHDLSHLSSFDRVEGIERYLCTGARKECETSKEVRDAGFKIEPDILASLVSRHDLSHLSSFDGVEGIARYLSVCLDEGVSAIEHPPLSLRQKIFGFNQYNEKPCRSFLTFAWEALQDITLIILMGCAIVSVGLGIATEGWPKGMYDGLGIIVCILLVVMVTAISDYRQFLQFRNLDKEKKKISVQVTRDGHRQKVSIYDLVVGDVVHLYPGDRVPADGIFLSGYSLLIDESSLSGESEPVNICEENPFLLSGTTVQDGSGKMLVTTVGLRTDWGRLMETLGEGGEDETPLQVKLNGVATIIGKIGLAFAMLTFVVLTVRFLLEKATHSELKGWSSSDALKLLNYFAIAVTIVVVAVPEGLPLAVTLSLAFAMKKLMNDGALVRRLSACETTGSVSCICTDKTGTLTTNHMVLEKIWICEEAKLIKGDDSGNVLKSAIPETVLRILLQSIFQNTGSEVVKCKDGKKNILGTPTESALLEFGLLLGSGSDAECQKFKPVKVEPFNSIRKTMSVIVALPAGVYRAFCKGAPEIILEMCDKIFNSSGESVHLSEAQRQYVTDIINGFASEALRILCLAFKDIDGTSNGHSIPVDGYTLIAVVGIKDPVRPGVKDAVQTCLAAGIMVRMITGDYINTAKSIARECGILTDDGLAIEGEDFRSKSPEEMKELIPKIQVIARSSPLDKHTLVTWLRNMFGEVVAVTGDGTNDAPALREADIGLAMGIAGTEVAKENADVIIMDDNFTTYVKLAKWGRAVYLNIQKFVQFQLTVNVVTLVFNFVSACISGSAPFTTFQLLWVNMIMDILGALALATEPPNDRLMERPPVGRSVNFITTNMWRNIIGQSIYQLAVLSVLKFDGKRLFKLRGSDAGSVLNTFIFNSLVFCQVFNQVNSREIEEINIFRGMFNSWLFIAVIVFEIAFQVIIVEFLGIFASTVPLSLQLWLLSILIGSLSMVVSVVLKCTKPTKHAVTANDNNGYVPLPSGP